MRTVALVGGAEITREAVNQSEADEIWAPNWSYKYKWLPRIDRLFEMHPIWLYGDIDKKEYIKPKQHYQWLQKAHDIPVYMLMQRPEVPDCISYPIDEVTEYIFGRRLLRGEEPSDFYSSSFDYMMALAIYEKWNVIELYGMEMGTDTEYRYQREGAAGFIMYAIAKGITVKRQPNSIILRTRKYGYEGGSMIFRQDLERMLSQAQERKRDAFARLQNYEGRMAIWELDGELNNDHQDKYQELRDDAITAAAVESLLIYQLREIDLEEPEMEIANPFAKIDMDV